MVAYKYGLVIKLSWKYRARINSFFQRLRGSHYDPGKFGGHWLKCGHIYYIQVNFVRGDFSLIGKAKKKTSSNRNHLRIQVLKVQGLKVWLRMPTEGSHVFCQRRFLPNDSRVHPPITAILYSIDP